MNSIQDKLTEILQFLLNNKKLNSDYYSSFFQILYHELVIDQELANKNTKVIIDSILYYLNLYYSFETINFNDNIKDNNNNNNLSKEIIEFVKSPRN